MKCKHIIDASKIIELLGLPRAQKMNVQRLIHFIPSNSEMITLRYQGMEATMTKEALHEVLSNCGLPWYIIGSSISVIGYKTDLVLDRGNENG